MAVVLRTALIFLQKFVFRTLGPRVSILHKQLAFSRYKSLEGYLRDEGCERLLARAIVGEAFTEAQGLYPCPCTVGI